MILRLVDRFDALGKRWPRVFAAVGFAWMMIVAFDQGKIIDLPEIPFLTGPIGIALAGVYNGLWWGVINPKIEKYRRQRDSDVKTMMKVAANG